MVCRLVGYSQCWSLLCSVGGRTVRAFEVPGMAGMRGGGTSCKACRVFHYEGPEFTGLGYGLGS